MVFNLSETSGDSGGGGTHTVSASYSAGTARILNTNDSWSTASVSKEAGSPVCIVISGGTVSAVTVSGITDYKYFDLTNSFSTSRYYVFTMPDEDVTFTATSSGPVL